MKLLFVVCARTNSLLPCIIHAILINNKYMAGLYHADLYSLSSQKTKVLQTLFKYESHVCVVDSHSFLLHYLFPCIF